MRLARHVVALLLLLSSAGLAQDVEVEWERGTDFSQFHSYTFAKEYFPINDVAANLGMALAVGEELEAKGLRLVAPKQKTYDLFVSYNARIVPDPQDSSRKSIVLRVRIFNSKDNNLIWHAGGSVPLQKDNADNQRNVRQKLAAMFQQYPPSK